MLNTWKALIAEESAKDYYKELKAFVDEEYASRTIYPPRKCILHALELTPLRNVKVVILGQDPYHEAGQAMGLSFSVPDGIALPPSLENIFKEIAREYGCQANQWRFVALGKARCPIAKHCANSART